MEITGIVLAGGKGLRLGLDKVSETVGNTSLLQKVVSSISSLCGEILVIISGERGIPSFTNAKLRVLTDMVPGKGPLVGIYTGLAASGSQYNLVVAADMPFLKKALLEYMISLSLGYDIVVPRVGDMVEPLHAVYSKNCQYSIEKMLRLGDLSVNRLLNLVRVRYVETEQIDKFDPEHLSFFNINTKADLEKARALLREEPR